MNEMRYSLGFLLPSSHLPMGRSATWCGDAGYNCTLVCVDPENELAFEYTPNQFASFVASYSEGGEPQRRELVEAVYDGGEAIMRSLSASSTSTNASSSSFVMSAVEQRRSSGRRVSPLLYVYVSFAL
eukprot:EC792158.1.p1 GENE.EC792158.1~~EC792158.1.p1  ORF type:complete len:128 (+),score=15.50 EC792158.1:86-469(+)